MRKCKLLVSFLLVASILCIIPFQTLANDVSISGFVPAHTHEWYFHHNNVGYAQIENSDTHHWKVLSSVYHCSYSGCEETDVQDGPIYAEEHSMTDYAYTGANYHEGAYHSIQYESTCPFCTYTVDYWESYRCPGDESGNGCVLPRSRQYRLVIN